MTQDDVTTLLAALKKAVSELEKALISKNAQNKGNYDRFDKKDGNFSGPSGGIKRLIADNFFDHPRQLAEVLMELKKLGYHYRRQPVATALLRAVRGLSLSRVDGVGDGHRKTWGYAKRK